MMIKGRGSAEFLKVIEEYSNSNVLNSISCRSYCRKGTSFSVPK